MLEDRERGRDGETDRERETERGRDRERDRERERQKEGGEHQILGFQDAKNNKKHQKVGQRG